MNIAKMRNVEFVVRNELCLSCGTCESVCPSRAIEVKLHCNKGIFIPYIDVSLCQGCKKCLDFCPGWRVPLKRLSKSFIQTENESIYLGRFLEVFAGHSQRVNVLEHASSGGMLTEAVLYLLENKIVDGALLCRLVTGPTIYGEGYFAFTSNEVLESQGSKYIPVPINKLIVRAVDSGKSFVFVGLPCHIEALRMMQDEYKNLAKTFPYILGSFCGGIKSINLIDKMIEAYSLKGQTITHFSFRGGGWPGSLTIKTSSGNIVSIPYPDYGGDVIEFKTRRCELCIDGTSELADLSFGDAWLDKYRKTNRGWSSVIARTLKGKDLINELASKNYIYLESLTEEEVIQSQWINLESKKKRQKARRSLFRILGWRVPIYDGGYEETMTSILFEIKVQISKFLNLKSEENLHFNKLIILLKFLLKLCKR